MNYSTSKMEDLYQNLDHKIEIKFKKIRYLIKLLFTGVAYDDLQINDMKKNLKNHF